jgi:hypothetical protein
MPESDWPPMPEATELALSSEAETQIYLVKAEITIVDTILSRYSSWLKPEEP